MNLLVFFFLKKNCLWKSKIKGLQNEQYVNSTALQRKMNNDTAQVLPFFFSAWEAFWLCKAVCFFTNVELYAESSPTSWRFPGRRAGAVSSSFSGTTFFCYKVQLQFYSLDYRLVWDLKLGHILMKKYPDFGGKKILSFSSGCWVTAVL